MCKDAFATLRFRCDKCGRQDRIWNSTEFAVAFSIPCGTTGCSGIQSRVDWHLAPKRKSFKVPVGTRYFALTTRRIAEEIILATRPSDAIWAPEEFNALVDKTLKLNKTALVTMRAEEAETVAG